MYQRSWCHPVKANSRPVSCLSCRLAFRPVASSRSVPPSRPVASLPVPSPLPVLSPPFRPVATLPVPSSSFPSRHPPSRLVAPLPVSTPPFPSRRLASCPFAHFPSCCPAFRLKRQHICYIMLKNRSAEYSSLEEYLQIVITVLTIKFIAEHTYFSQFPRRCKLHGFDGILHYD